MGRWTSALVLLLAGVALAIQGVRSDNSSNFVLCVGALVVAWWFSPLNGRGGPRHTEVESRPDDFPVVIYWRPGCVYCMRLRGALGKDKDRATWISIWADEDAAAFVRSVNNGNETVPTVRVGETVRTNPDPAIIKTALR
ncbi:glutaredoxin domain-containing protein [Janibacter cremeus]|uniref:Mycoredoxin n=1 Tax=Janibacter cremeus TaxID=1285192 RepID=A0A852VRW4_9MICO|nr:glutaredoxin domain-containing protein [Janibacter cremeus]NYF97074.1 mycoredoxin [Janibacter cremeus]